MVTATTPDDQATRLQELRRDADRAIWYALQGSTRDALTRAQAIELLDRFSAVLHNDVAIYRGRLLEEITTDPGLTRRLRLVPTSAAYTAQEIGLRTPGDDAS